jgi:TPR repeat protein
MAEYELAELYEAGNGVDRNFDTARVLYTDAASRGVPGAKERLVALNAAHPPPPEQTTAAPIRGTMK